MEGFKVCTKCGIEKPLDMFPKGKNSCKACAYQYQKQWLKNSPTGREKLLVYKRNYNSKPDVKLHAKEYQRERTHTIEGSVVESKSGLKRREAIKKTPNTLTEKQWLKILQMQQNKCQMCGREFSDVLKPERDHIIPLSLGGGLTFGNTQALCHSCNSSKGSKCIIGKAMTEVFVGVV